jgi:hypothetical protein
MTDRANLDVIIRTSSPGWLASLASAYRWQRSVELLDDARIGIDPIRDTLLDMGKKAKLSHREWLAVLVALGIGFAGAYLLIMAILDPEPYSKIAIALATGGLLIAGGGFTAIRVLVGHRPPTIRISPNGGFEIFFD